MPGKVIEAHKKFENQCSKCHKKLGSKGDSSLCLSCHKRVAADVKHHTGFHGKSPGVQKGECRVCHTEHIGRKGDVVKFAAQSFNHQNTDFPLTGLHQQVECQSCHKTGLKYRDASTQCAQCHQKNNPHGMQLKNNKQKFQPCDACHTTRGWLGIKFNHAETKFALKGKHQRIPCQSCHKNDHFHGVSSTCYSCHKINDVHQGSQGKKCQSCHNTFSWKKISFDHDQTDFPLHGKHKPLACDSCHKGDPKKDKLKTTCISCHRQDDVHTTRFGNKCQKCHSESGWETNKFSHNRDTKFTLKGKHAHLKCFSCHKGNIYKNKLKTNCYACHQFDDVHRNKRGRNCGQCHNEKSWSGKVLFEHDTTRFPLIGMHAVTPCEECHLNKKYQTTQRKCIACHKSKDIHHGTLGEKCQKCHTPNDWGIWVFDHNKQTDFKLTGKHEGLSCNQCHYKPLAEMKTKVGDCVACHSGDDIHHGQFGNNCQRCHSTESFKDLKNFH